MCPIPTSEREIFDDLLEDVLSGLPTEVAQLLKELPVIVDDEPTEQILRDMGIRADDPRAPSDLCGLHWGIPLGSRSVLDGEPELDRILIFRGPILRLAGKRKAELRKQIRITVLHEIGHHFGLDEDDLEKLGYS